MAPPEVFPPRNGQHFENKGGNVQFQGTAINSTFNMALAEDNCLKDLHCTDPRLDKKRIEEAKGDLLEGSYRWIFNNHDFQQWRNDESRLLWISGDPGKGKTMLLCGIITNLMPETRLGDPEASRLLSFFFFQADYSLISNRTAMVRSLIYLLAVQQPSLLSHVRKQYDVKGKDVFEGVNAWAALSEIFTNILHDPSLGSTYLIIDALDECEADLPKLLEFIAEKSSICPRVKWIVSSRKWPEIKEQLDNAGQNLSLELNRESVSTAVGTFIRHKVDKLAQLKKYDDKTRVAVQHYLLSNADDTFLWVALVCENLKNIRRFQTRTKLNEFPPNLDSLYKKMMDQICNSDVAALCKRILASIVIVYRPITLEELKSLVEMPEELSNDPESVREVIDLCGSFLTVQECTINLVHKSAKDFLVEKAYNEIYPSGIEYVHHTVFSRSLQVMYEKLGRDVYGLGAPGCPIDQVKQPDSDPLSSARYSCVYWINHLLDCDPTRNAINGLQNGGSVDKFLRRSYLYWLEALSLCRSLSEGVVVSMAKLKAILQGRADGSALAGFLEDAEKFILSFRPIIERAPLQTYGAALAFCPMESKVKKQYLNELFPFIKPIKGIRDSWGLCIQTLEHTEMVNAVAFSPDGQRLASASSDNTVRFWNSVTGTLQQTLEGHSGGISAIAFSSDSQRLASASADSTVRLWDVTTGALQQTLEVYSAGNHGVAFSPDGQRLAYASADDTVGLWDLTEGVLQKTFQGHSSWVSRVAFSPDGQRLASASADRTIRLWNMATDTLQKTLKGHNEVVNSVAFSPDSQRLASAARDGTVRLWDVTAGTLQQTLKGHDDFFGYHWGHSGHWVTTVVFSPDGQKLASAADDNTVRLWDPVTGTLQQTLRGHDGMVNDIAFSPDSQRLASASPDRTVRLWDLAINGYQETHEHHNGHVYGVVFSPGNQRLASASADGTVRLWDPTTGMLQQILEGHTHRVYDVAFSPDNQRLASASADDTVRLWDLITGTLLKTIKVHTRYSTGGVGSVDFSPDGQRLASASDQVRLWDVTTGTLQQTLEGHSSNWVTAVVFSPDGQRLASAASDNTVRLWDPATGTLQQTLEGYAPVFSPDSQTLALASAGGTVQLWDLTTGVHLRTLEVNLSAYPLSFPEDGRYIKTKRGYLPLNSDSFNTNSDGNPSDCTVFVGGEWVSQDGEDVLWLPVDYRATCVAVSDNVLVLGHRSGRVTFFTFEVSKADK